jgi:hypothetical protein
MPKSMSKAKPLSPDIRKRLRAFHTSGGGEASWQDIADAITGISGPSMANYVVKGTKVQNPQTADRILRVLEHYEKERDGVTQLAQAPDPVPTSNDFSLEHLMGLISAKGYAVSVTMAA